jgi:hypothetical protein
LRVAVGAELFPLVTIGVSKHDMIIGVSVGFVIGLGLVFGLETVIDCITNSSISCGTTKSQGDLSDSDNEITEETKSPNCLLVGDEKHTEGDIELGIPRNQKSTASPNSTRKGKTPSDSNTTTPTPDERTRLVPFTKTKVDADFGVIEDEYLKQPHKHLVKEAVPGAAAAQNGGQARTSPRTRSRSSSNGEQVHYEAAPDAEWDDDTVKVSARALRLPQHRGHIMEHLHELMESIQSIEMNCLRLADCSRPVSQLEQISEQIDEATHLLQYKLDHTRRFAIM